ncbi:MAG: hypothetical protein GXP30_07510 [Verrucomicrobia bacterium]|nr:hypothetical protein [Verrucomicrobiota bacterium]
MTKTMVERLSHRLHFHSISLALLLGTSFAWLSSVTAQQVGLPAGSDADHKRLIRLRAEAQAAQQDAQLAALRRTATQSTDKSNRDSVLARARLDKEFKRRAALAVQQQQAINAYEKIKQSEIDSWSGKGEKISRGVPSDFTANLPPLDEGTKKKKGLLNGMANAPGKALKGLASLRPRLFSKKSKQAYSDPVAQFAPPESLSLDSVAPRIPEPVAPVESETIDPPKKRGFRIPLVSKLTGGKKGNENPYIAEEKPSDSPEQMQADESAVSDTPPEKKKGFFGIASIGNKNKNNAEDTGDYYGPDSADIASEETKSGFLSKFSLKKNKEENVQDVGDGPTESGNSPRKDIYVVDTQKAQFFPFGETGKQADAQSLGEGTIVRMTKSGDDWSSIELSSGSMGVIRNKYLRKAKSKEVPSNMFAHKPKAPYPTTARISKPRSATGKGATHRYREPVNVPLPDLPSGGAELDSPIGNGLLPPLQESAIQ